MKVADVPSADSAAPVGEAPIPAPTAPPIPAPPTSAPVARHPLGPPAEALDGSESQAAKPRFDRKDDENQPHRSEETFEDSIRSESEATEMRQSSAESAAAAASVMTPTAPSVVEEPKRKLEEPTAVGYVAGAAAAVVTPVAVAPPPGEAPLRENESTRRLPARPQTILAIDRRHRRAERPALRRHVLPSATVPTRSSIPRTIRCRPSV